MPVVGSGAMPTSPQYAIFDDDKRRGGDDSLPAMPVWDEAGSKKIMTHDDAVELESLKKSNVAATATPTTLSGSTAASTISPTPASIVAQLANGRSTPVARGQSPAVVGVMAAGAGAAAAGPYGRQLERIPTASSVATGPRSQMVGMPQPRRANTYAIDSYNTGSNNNLNNGAAGYGQYANSSSDAYSARSNSAAGYAQGQGQGWQQTSAGAAGPYGQRGYNNGRSDYGYGQQQQQQTGYAGDAQGYQQNRQDYGQDYDADYGHGGQAGYGQNQFHDQSRGYDQGYDQGYSQPSYTQPTQPYTQSPYSKSTNAYNDYDDDFNQPYDQPYSSHTPQQAYNTAPAYSDTRADMPPVSPARLNSPSSPGLSRLVNNAGFDFSSDYSRPETPQATPPPARQLAGGARAPVHRRDTDELFGV